MKTKTCAVRVIVGHSLFVFLEAIINALSDEGWGLFFSYLVDLPISIFFHSVLEHIAIQSRYWTLLSLHILLGGAWWMAIVCGGIRMIAVLNKQSQR